MTLTIDQNESGGIDNERSNEWVNMTISNALASVAVKDIQAGTQWCAKVIGRLADSTPTPELAEWKFPSGGWLQVYALAERAGSCSCTLAVSSIDAEAARLENLGVSTGNQMGEQVKVFMVKDPDGNSIAFAQSPDRAATHDSIAIARAGYDAYVSKDRAAIEALIADDFHFSSPLDNRLDRATYFDRCCTTKMPRPLRISMPRLFQTVQSLPSTMHQATIQAARKAMC